MAVFVLGSDNRPLMPCSERRARLLLERGRAGVVRVKPFVIRLKDRTQDNCELQSLELKIDPGSKTTGICISCTVNDVVNVVQLIELTHRGQQIKLQLRKRTILRRNRRSRNTRYRPARFLNRTKPEGWLPPSLMHRIQTTMSWVVRLRKWLPITVIVVERVKFDTQKMQNVDISGIEYQQGTLFNYEVKEYLLEKFNRTCMYCDMTEAFLEIEHIVSRARGGSNRISNLGLACARCNKLKGSQSIEDFMINAPIKLEKIKKQLKTPLRDAAMMNATRNRLLSELQNTGLPVFIGTGAQTKYNRSKLHVPKTHALDAACVGNVVGINHWKRPHLEIKCTGRGRYQRTNVDKYGFPKYYSMKTKKVFGFQTGDLVKTTIKKLDQPKNSVLEIIISRIGVQANGYFTALHKGNLVSTPHYRCKLIQHADGYDYSVKN